MHLRLPIVLAAAALSLLQSPNVSAQAPAKPAGGEITNLDDPVTELPRELLVALRNASRKEESATQATAILHEKVEGRKATLSFKVEKVEKYLVKGETLERYRVKAEEERIHGSIPNFKTFLWVHFDPGESAKVADLKKGTEITASGNVTLASIVAKTNAELHIDLSNAVVK